jgi:hypothetical protein
MANLMFKKGLHENLPKNGIAGTIYFTTDEGGMYIANDDSTLKRV